MVSRAVTCSAEQRSKVVLEAPYLLDQVVAKVGSDAVKGRFDLGAELQLVVRVGPRVRAGEFSPTSQFVNRVKNRQDGVFSTSR